MTNRTTREQHPQFLIDGMLGSLARKLRILGFDTWYDPKSSDNQLLDNAKSAKRWLVTSDVELYRICKRRGVRAILVKSRSERERLFEVLSKIGMRGVVEIDNARCSICNGLLTDFGKMRNAERVLTCTVCGKDYWKGSHWKKLSKLFSEVELLLTEQRDLVEP